MTIVFRPPVRERRVVLPEPEYDRPRTPKEVNAALARERARAGMGNGEEPLSDGPLKVFGLMTMPTQVTVTLLSTGQVVEGEVEPGAIGKSWREPTVVTVEEAAILRGAGYSAQLEES